MKPTDCPSASPYVESPPVRGRGLKPLIHFYKDLGPESPPVRGRGLKQLLFVQRMKRTQSPPVRGRGLKLVSLQVFSG